jgi:hypothetical protein|tara:strand:- start:1820 stop:2116 length:297 start_codon:yes stop_codon:yes gene_type:complete
LAGKGDGKHRSASRRVAGIGFGDPERLAKIPAARPSSLFHLFKEMLVSDFEVPWHEASSSVAGREGSSIIGVIELIDRKKGLRRENGFKISFLRHQTP